MQIPLAHLVSRFGPRNPVSRPLEAIPEVFGAAESARGADAEAAAFYLAEALGSG